MKFVHSYIIKPVFYLVVLLLLLLGSAMLALQLPAVQTRATHYATDWLSKNLGQTVSVARANIKWFDVVSLDGVLIRDRASRPMIEVNQLNLDLNTNLKIDFQAARILDGQSPLVIKTFSVALSEATLYQPKVWLVYDPKTGQLNINDFIAAIAKMTGSDTAPVKDPNSNTPFMIPRLNLVDGTFTMDDPRKAYTKGRTFDYNHFTLKALNVEANNFVILGDTIAFDAKNLRAFDRQTNLTIKQLDTKFLYCAKKIALNNLYARIGSSVIRNNLVMNFNDPSDMGDFNNKVVLEAHLDSTKIASQDLGYFADYLFSTNETWRLNGDFVGTVANFKLKNFAGSFGKNSRLVGDLAFKGLPDFSKTTMAFALKPSRIDANDLYQYYPEKSFTDLVRKFGVVDFVGNFKGTTDDFVLTKSDFKTALGQIKGDLALKLNKNSSLSTYSGDIETKGFDLGQFLGDPQTIQRIDMAGKISGRGFSVKDAVVKLDGNIARLGYNNYEYRNIYARGNLQRKYFEGKLTVNDPHLKMAVDGQFDFSGKQYAYNAAGRIEFAELKNLRFMDDSLTLHTDLDVQFVGNSIDEMVGKARFLNSYLTLKKRSLIIDTLLVDSQIAQNGDRVLTIDSEFITAHAQGSFQPTRAVDDIGRLFKEYRLYFFGDEVQRVAYYAGKQMAGSQGRYSVNFDAKTKQINKLLAFAAPDIFLSRGAVIDGAFTLGNTSILNLTASADTFKVGTNAFYKSDIDLNTSKFTNKQEVLASAIITSDRQTFGSLAPTEKLNVEASWETDHISFLSDLRQANSTNRATLNGDARFVGDVIELQFRRSKFKLLDGDWKLAADNLMTFSNQEVTLRNMVVTNGQQRIAANGSISTDSLKNLILEAKDVQLATLNPVLNTNLSGTLNGIAGLRDLYDQSVIESKVGVKDLRYNDYKMGDLESELAWDPVDKHLHVDAHLDQKSKRVISVSGSYDPNKTKNAFDLEATFNETDLSLIEPFAKGLVSDISGRAVGKIKVKGTPTDPILDGEVDVKKGRLRFDYLKAIFAFEDKITFGESEIRTKKMLLTDPEGNTATLRGGVYHDHFTQFLLNFEAEMKNFKMLNTTIKDNEMFYGTAYATGRLDVVGPINNLNIKTNLTSNRGTKIYIPLDGATEVASQDFVQFVSSKTAKKNTGESDSTANEARGELAGIKLDLRFTLTPDAYCEIKLDRRTDDAIKAYGNGQIRLNIDTKGSFEMTGNYEIDRGKYIFTFQGIANKEFEIKSGSRITWLGDPYKAQLSMKAVYQRAASLANLISDGTGATNQALNTQRYPVELILNITDKITAPQISYDLQFKEYPANARLRIQGIQNKLRDDEQYLAQQVSSFLLFNQFFPDNSNIFSQQVNVTNTMTEVITNQLNKWASTLNENLELGVSGVSFFGQDQQNNVNNLQLRFSYRFLNDRFRISRDGRLSYGQNQFDASTLLNDWTLEYWFKPDGSQRLKMYNRNIQNQFTLSNFAVSYGASFLYTKTFDRVRLFGPKPTPAVTPPPPDPKTEAGKLTTQVLQ